MSRGSERIQWISAALQDAGLAALVCTVPENVLLLSGYWPVVGTAVAVARRDGHVAILAPRDEQELAMGGWAAEVRTYPPGSLESLVSPIQAVAEPLGTLLTDLGVSGAKLGYEDGTIYVESSYAAMYLFQAGIRGLLADVAPDASLTSAGAAISGLRSALTPDEVSQVRLGGQIAGQVFGEQARHLRPGLRESQVAAAFTAPMSVLGLEHAGVQRAGAYMWCMSGPNSALAGAAYARTRDRALQRGDLVLVHCNSYVNGYWTDITRTYCLGQPSERQRAMYEAVLAARAAALRAILPGVAAAAVDAAARRVLSGRGFGQYFTHGLGHNVGFSAISAEFPPRLHPASPDHLEVGMTFNVEPSIYIPGFGGLRHCDVVTLHPKGPEVLTPFQADLAELVVDA